MLEFIVIAGPTGSGKTGLALEVVQRLREFDREAEIISADSIAVYRGFDIGAAKPNAKEKELAPHHLIDICDPKEDFTAGDFVREAERAIEIIRSRNAFPIIVGGTGFYLRAFIQGMAESETPGDKAALAKIENAFRLRAEEEGMGELYQEMLQLDPVLSKTIHENDHYRIFRALSAMELHKKKWSELNAGASSRPARHENIKFFALDLDRPALADRVAKRTESMLAAGLLNEVKSLIEAGVPLTAKAFLSVGYFECLQFLGKIPQVNPQLPITNEKSLREAITRATMKLAKSQMTYLRGQFKKIEWIQPGTDTKNTIVGQI